MCTAIVVIAAIVAVLAASFRIAQPFVINWDDRRHGLPNRPHPQPAPDEATAVAGRVRSILER